jgi:hypothetical protein
VIVLAAPGAYLLLTQRRSRHGTATSQYGLLVLGSLIAAIGVINYFHIQGFINDLKQAFPELSDSSINASVSVGIGVYLLILGGAITAICAYLFEQQKLKAG